MYSIKRPSLINNALITSGIPKSDRVEKGVEEKLVTIISYLILSVPSREEELSSSCWLPPAATESAVLLPTLPFPLFNLAGCLSGLVLPPEALTGTGLLFGFYRLVDDVRSLVTFVLYTLTHSQLFANWTVFVNAMITTLLKPFPRLAGSYFCVYISSDTFNYYMLYNCTSCGNAL